MDWNRAFNWVAGYVLRWTAGAFAFGMILEFLLSGQHQAFRVEVPVLLTTLIFTLAMCGTTLALYFVYLMQKYGGRA